jgi:hypothetical protein
MKEYHSLLKNEDPNLVKVIKIAIKIWSKN